MKPVTAAPTEALDEVEAPPGDDREFIGFRVAGDANYPAFFNGDVIYTEPPSEPDDRHLGKQCIVTLRDGERRLGILARGDAPGRYLLLSHNASPLADIEVREAGAIAWIRRG